MMNTPWDGLLALAMAPFADFGFMRRALAGSLALALSAGPLGVILQWRRMSLVGDAMAHALLPGVALGYLLFGLSLPAMTFGGLGAGLAVALLAGLVSRYTDIPEDASFASFYLVSLALGVLLMSLRGSNADLLGVLFGSALALDDPTLLLVAGIATVSLVGLALIYRPLLAGCVDPQFLQSQGWHGGLAHGLFLLLLVLSLVGGFHALGTLMAVAFLILPAATARLWVRSIAAQMGWAVAVAIVSSGLGLLLSFHRAVPASPAIVLVAGLLYGVSLLVGCHGSLLARGRGRRRPRSAAASPSIPHSRAPAFPAGGTP